MKKTLEEQLSRIKNMMGLNEAYEDWADTGERIARDSASDWPNNDENEREGELGGLEDSTEIDDSHGSPYDRGRADSWYRRERNPHKMVIGINGGERIPLTDPKEIEEYLMGYNDNTDHKSWGSDF